MKKWISLLCLLPSFAWAVPNACPATLDSTCDGGDSFWSLCTPTQNPLPLSKSVIISYAGQNEGPVACYYSDGVGLGVLASSQSTTKVVPVNPDEWQRSLTRVGTLFFSCDPSLSCEFAVE